MNIQNLITIIVLSLLCQNISASKIAPFLSQEWVQPGDTVFSLLKKHGFSSEERSQLLRSGLIPKHLTLIPGQQFLVKKMEDSTQLKIYEDSQDMAHVFWRDDTGAGVMTKKEEFRIEQIIIEGNVQGSLIASLKRFITDERVIYRFLDAFVFEFESDLNRKIKKNAYFSLMLEKKFDGALFIKYGEVLNARLEIDSRIISKEFLPFNEGGVFTSENLFEERKFFAPVNYLRVSSRFQRRRRHPITKRLVPHLGVDFELPVSRPVYAISSGKVKKTGRSRGAGNYIVIKHDGKTQSHYAHLDTIANNLKSGSHIKAGQIIGSVGCTGYCTKPHLHFAIKSNGRYVNPLPLLRPYPYHFAPRLREIKLSQLKNM